jgi:two-component system CheB/CheR fusion protein
VIKDKPTTPKKVLVPPINTNLVPSFPIVGIGASAGGMTALIELFENLPSDTGMAFVVLQYLDPKHESRLAETLSLITKIPVKTVIDGIQVHPNTVYIIASKFCHLTIQKKQLRLSLLGEVKNKYTIIDDFFISLAKIQKNKAIGVVLSGRDKDGIKGLTSIKSAGGLTFAQDPGTAEHKLKPFSAMDQGNVNDVLPPKGIAEELAKISK